MLEIALGPYSGALMEIPGFEIGEFEPFAMLGKKLEALVPLNNKGMRDPDESGKARSCIGVHSTCGERVHVWGCSPRHVVVVCGGCDMKIVVESEDLSTPNKLRAYCDKRGIKKE